MSGSLGPLTVVIVSPAVDDNILYVKKQFAVTAYFSLLDKENICWCFTYPFHLLFNKAAAGTSASVHRNTGIVRLRKCSDLGFSNNDVAI